MKQYVVIVILIIIAYSVLLWVAISTIVKKETKPVDKPVSYTVEFTSEEEEDCQKFVEYTYSDMHFPDLEKLDRLPLRTPMHKKHKRRKK